jgi:hypothetical protein
MCAPVGDHLMLNCPAYDIAPTASETLPTNGRTGNTSSNRAPARYSDISGPGMSALVTLTR